REGADRLSLVAPRLRLSQHQRQPRAAEGRARPPGDLVRGGPGPDPARGRLGFRPPHRAGHRTHEAMAAPRGAMDEVLPARSGPRQEAHGRRRPGGGLHREARRDSDLPHDGFGRAGRAAQLKRIGITVEIENVEYAVWIKRWLAKDFDMTMNTTPGYADPDTAFF